MVDIVAIGGNALGMPPPVRKAEQPNGLSNWGATACAVQELVSSQIYAGHSGALHHGESPRWVMRATIRVKLPIASLAGPTMPRLGRVTKRAVCGTMCEPETSAPCSPGTHGLAPRAHKSRDARSHLPTSSRTIFPLVRRACVAARGRGEGVRKQLFQNLCGLLCILFRYRASAPSAAHGD